LISGIHREDLAFYAYTLQIWLSLQNTPLLLTENEMSMDMAFEFVNKTKPVMTTDKPEDVLNFR
jgi:hypothetical protein